MEEKSDPQSAPSDASELPTRRLTPSAAQGLLAAAGTDVTRNLRGWEPPSAEVLQKALPQYEISAFIAHGGMGAVYKGVQRSLKRPVAIKILPPDIDDGEAQFAARFKHEAQAMARLSHPNIVAVFDAGEVEIGWGSTAGRTGESGGRDRPPGDPVNDGAPGGRAPPQQLHGTGQAVGIDRRAIREGEGESGANDGAPGGRAPPVRGRAPPRTLLYFVMEFIEGTDVQQLIASEGQIDPKRAVQITCAVCDALAFAHEEGIIHRDIKPSNVMIDKKGRVKVADFGLAKAVNLESTMLTGTNMAMGTPDFMAPESLVAGILVDQRADIYAVGVMLYQMLTGTLPRGRFTPISSTVPKSGKRFDAIVDKAMQADRDKRYSTASELKRDVEKVVPRSTKDGSADALVRHQSTGGAAAKHEAHRSVRAPLLFGVAIIVLGTGGWMMWKKGAAPAAAPVAASSPGLPMSASSSSAPTALPDGPPGFVKEFSGLEGKVKGEGFMAFLPDGKRLLACSSDKNKEGKSDANEVIVWDIASGQPLWHTALRELAGPLSRGAVLSALNQAAILQRGVPMVIHYVDLQHGTATGQAIVPGPKGYQRQGDVIAAPDGRRFMLAALSGESGAIGKLSLHVWEGGASKPVASWEIGACSGYASSTWLDNQHVAVSYRPGANGLQVILINTAKPGETVPLGTLKEGGRLATVGSRPDQLLWQAQNNQLELFDLGSKSVQRRIPVPKAQRQLAFVDHQRILGLPEALGDALRLWDVDTGKLVWEQADARLFDLMVVSPDGRYAATNEREEVVNGNAQPGSKVLLWRLPKMETAEGRAAVGGGDRPPGDPVAAKSAHAANGAPGGRALPSAATKDAPFVNTLGMKFVPVPITGGPTDKQRVLFSIWETRVQDFEAFARETQRKLPFPGWLNLPAHAANNVSWKDAKAFCAWLTERERKAGRIGGSDEYRLPFDHEWSCAVGIGDRENPGAAPADKSNRLPGVYPWGTTWPPPAGSGNFADEAIKASKSPDAGTGETIEGYDDGFAFVAPVGSFTPNALGLYDLAGNVGELCEELERPSSTNHFIRGATYRAGQRGTLSDQRSPVPPDHSSYLIGFRVVLAAAAPAVSVTPSTATKDAPFVNTLGMKFVPVPITGGPTDKERVLFSIWETRVQDYEVFAKETKRAWPKPDAEPGATHPAVGMSWNDATAYCAWLTERERTAGKLGSDVAYRLPSDHEWSCAVGIGEREDAAKLPAQKDQKIAGVFPRGSVWPPPENSGNYWSEELRPLLAAGKYGYIRKTTQLVSYHDGYATTAPVGSYAANHYGLHDLGGNAWEWCEDWADEKHQNRVWRGASWTIDDPGNLLSSRHTSHPPDDQGVDNGVGFRVVLAPGSTSAKKP